MWAAITITNIHTNKIKLKQWWKYLSLSRWASMSAWCCRKTSSCVVELPNWFWNSSSSSLLYSRFPLFAETYLFFSILFHTFATAEKLTFHSLELLFEKKIKIWQLVRLRWIGSLQQFSAAIVGVLSALAQFVHHCCFGWERETKRDSDRVSRLNISLPALNFPKQTVLFFCQHCLKKKVVGVNCRVGTETEKKNKQTNKLDFEAVLPFLPEAALALHQI